ncbi:hypothetical protein AcW1_004276 [Taiwanofungus camphoratus]|nr:hypothetical protein AcW2_006713 [Antrodia cinnamomea]KAI0939165.1 hypothetical protein AcV5_000656 [Antrodia cinnamomea]KAI0959458.1 hypothetical protein AcW1_004276 [Antrodia cinnamomea]
MNQLHSTNKDLESTNSPTQTFVAQRDILKWISNEYHDLNGTYYDVLDLPPSSLRFSQLVHIARPVLIRNCGIPSDSISRRWTDEYLLQRLADREISIAITPNGRADAVMDGPDGRKYFVEPHVQKMTMSNFLANLSTDCCIGDEVAGRMKEIHYLQSQNGNLYSNRYFDLGPKNDPSEFESLRSDVPSEILWCSEALGRSPDAVNLWIGDSASVTSIHSDPYENIYTVIRGAKHFTLLPPTEGWCLEEHTYPQARYTRSPVSSQLELELSDTTTPTVRWSSVTDPTVPGALPPEAHPIDITVRAGETLYLPAGWWHYVRQSEITIAVNYWYDMESRGMKWVWLNFLRGLRDPPSGNADVGDDDGP